jgi:translation initiation factor IF-3
MADRLKTNAEIRAKEVRLIGPEGKQVGIVPLKVAIEAAQALDLDLVEVSPQAQPPVAKVMDYGKHLYETERAEREQRKQQRASGQKAIRLRPKIDDHDFETKARMARRFLEGGHGVRVQVMYRRREMRRPELGEDLLDRLAEELRDVASVEARHPMEGRFATMVLGPRKTERAERAERPAGKRSSGAPAEVDLREAEPASTS